MSSDPVAGAGAAGAGAGAAGVGGCTIWPTESNLCGVVGKEVSEWIWSHQSIHWISIGIDV